MPKKFSGKTTYITSIVAKHLVKSTKYLKLANSVVHLMTIF